MHTTRRWLCGAMLASAAAWMSIVPGCSASQDEAKKYDPGGDAAGFDGTGGDPTGDDAGPTKPLCESLGGYAAVQKLSADALAKVNQDCRIGAYFTSLSTDEQQHHAECFETFLASSAQCTDGTGSKILYIGSKDTHGVECKKIPDAHQKLGLSRDDYTAFQQDVVASMTDAKIAQDLRNAVVGIFNGQPGVYSPNKTGNTKCDYMSCDKCVAQPDAGDGGKDADTGTGITDASDGGG